MTTTTEQDIPRRWFPEDDQELEQSATISATEYGYRRGVTAEQATPAAQRGRRVFVSVSTGEAQTTFLRAFQVFIQQWPHPGGSYDYRLIWEPTYRGQPTDGIATTVPWPDLIESDSEANSLWRGVAVVTHSRRPIFEDSIHFRPGSLPRWRPRIIIDRRIRELNDV